MRALKHRFGRPKLTALRLGVAFVVLSLVVGVALFQKDRITTALKPGTTIPIMFSQDYRLRQFVADAKIAGVPVGTVTSSERTGKGTTEVQVKVDNDVRRKLGTAPSAEIRPTTMLGGNYYVDLKPGGRRGTFTGTIPASRTKLPVELDKLASALQPDARRGLQSTVRNLESTLNNGGSEALRDLTVHAPGTLDPAARVFEGVRGTRPGVDLPNLVQGLESTSRVLSEQQNHLGGIVHDLRDTSSVLGRRRGDIATTIAGMPSTLNNTDRGLDHLDTTLAKLRDTAEPARPAVRELDNVLKHLDPVLVKARPIVHDLRAVVADARPLVRELAPTSQQLTSVFDDLRGPVLNRVTGPIMHTVKSPYKGSGPYTGSGGDRPFYQELAFMIANADRANMTDKNGSMISFHAGAGPGSVAGMPLSLEQLFRQLAERQGGGQ